MIETAHESTKGAENLHHCYAWRLEKCMVWIRWLAVPACLVVLPLSPQVSALRIGFLAGSLALGNLGIDRLLRRQPHPARIRLTCVLATGLEWGVALGIIGGCSRDLPRTVPAVLVILLALVVIGAARHGLAGSIGALGGAIALFVLTVLVVHPSVGWGAVAAWVTLVAASSAIIGGVLLWFRQQLEAEEQQRQAEHIALRRLQEERSQWDAERTTLQRMALRIWHRESEILPLLAREDLTYEQIAELLAISPETVKTHVHRLSEKLGVTGRHAIIVAACEHGLLPHAG